MVIGENTSPDSWFTEYPTNLEFGVALFKNHPTTFDILRYVYYNDTEEAKHMWAEQYCLMKLLNRHPEYNHVVKRIDSNLINVTNHRFESVDKTFIYHYACGHIPIQEKIQGITKILDSL
jgi:hypothetical protein